MVVDSIPQEGTLQWILQIVTEHSLQIVTQKHNLR